MSVCTGNPLSRGMRARRGPPRGTGTFPEGHPLLSDADAAVLQTFPPRAPAPPATPSAFLLILILILILIRFGLPFILILILILLLVLVPFAGRRRVGV